MFTCLLEMSPPLDPPLVPMLLLPSLYSPPTRVLRILQCVMDEIKVSQDINALDKLWAQELCSDQSYLQQAARGK